MTNNSGQMEIMGLVVIVILVTLGMLFMALFAFDEEIQKNVFVRKGLATSTLGAGFKATVAPDVGCAEGYGGRGDLPQLGEDILEDCAIFREEYWVDNHVNPHGYSQYQCSSIHSCQFFNDTMALLLNTTLGAWGKRYEFNSTFITSTGNLPLFRITDVSGRGCPGERDASGLFPIQVRDSGLVESQLYVCD